VHTDIDMSPIKDDRPSAGTEQLPKAGWHDAHDHALRPQQYRSWGNYMADAKLKQ